MHRQTGRQKEAALIRQANRAAAVGRLLLGEVRDWSEFLEPEVADLANLPRRQLKSGKADVRGRLSRQLMSFPRRSRRIIHYVELNIMDQFSRAPKVSVIKNFVGMNVVRLSQMYEEIKALRGMELPLSEFESRFARVRPEVLKGNPAHLTVSVSLWGFQLKVPEEQLAPDVMEAADLADDANRNWRLLKV